MSYLANALTTLSLLCGFISIIASLEKHFTYSAWAIILSVIFDGLDGQVARSSKGTSEFGKELDSLVDVISFGIAPCVLGYIFVYKNFYFLATCALFIYLVCSITRLAKYNITPKEKLARYFYGLPTTMSGGILASFILVYRRHTKLPPQLVFLLLVLLLATLMVSKARYPNPDGIKLILANKILPLLVIALVIFVITPEVTLLTLFASYLIFSPFILRKFV